MKTHLNGRHKMTVNNKSLSVYKLQISIYIHYTYYIIHTYISYISVR